jgi:glycosyltransferase involved in cell wall biosynthesis
MSIQKIMLISDGDIPVPPNGWGALERVVWNYSQHLIKRGYDVLISNHKESSKVLEDWRKFKPDVVHNRIGKHWEAMSLIYGCKKIVTNYGGAFIYHKPFYDYVFTNYLTDCDLYVLTDEEKQFYASYNIWKTNIVVPDGVDSLLFNKNPSIRHGSIYLGKISLRKRQSYYQKLGINCYFAGDPEDDNFNYSNPKYLGQWTHEEVANNLCKFNSLVLLSSSELQPLVCLEALCSGLGLVISKPCSQSLDLSKPWISVIPEDKLNDINFINDEINRISNLSELHRKEIIDYGKSFDWSNIIDKYVDLINE